MSKEVLAVILAFVVLAAFSDYGVVYTQQTLYECHEVSGTITAKEDSNGPLALYIVLTEGGEAANYKVYVGPTLFEEYDVGDTYTERMCEITAYQEFTNMIGELLSAGILEEF
jgi:hypothetical protein